MKYTRYQVDWDTINSLSIAETCEWLNIPISHNRKIQCPSPNHEDKNPSCSISKGRYCHCFSCGFSADSLKLVQTVLNCSEFKAKQFIDKHVKVLIPLEENLASDLRFEPWELACLGLKQNPLLRQIVRIQEQDGERKTSVPFQAEELQALEIINDKFLENCVTEKAFVSRYEKHVLSLLYRLITDSEPKLQNNPFSELWKYSSKESFQEAEKAYSKKKNNYMKKNTGLNFSTLESWYFDEKDKLLSQIIRRHGKDLYESLVKKIDIVISILEQNEDNMEETQNDRKVQSTVVR